MNLLDNHPEFRDVTFAFAGRMQKLLNIDVKSVELLLLFRHLFLKKGADPSTHATLTTYQQCWPDAVAYGHAHGRPGSGITRNVDEVRSLPPRLE
jgi:hypothetical protein